MKFLTHHRLLGKSKESDPTNTLANALVDTPPTHYRHVSQQTTDASADTLPICLYTTTELRLHGCVMRVPVPDTDGLVDTLPTHRSTHYRHVGRNTYSLEFCYFFQLEARTTS